VTLLTGSSVQTAVTTATANAITLGNYSRTTGNNYQNFLMVDDLYVCSTAGSVNNDFLGERRVYTLFPTGAGGHTQWTIAGSSPAATNWQSVNNATPDADVTSVISSTTGQIDTYAFGDLPASTTVINGVQFNHVARRDDAGVLTIAPEQRNAGSDAAGTTSANLSPAYLDVLTVQENSLLTAVAWTPSEINASEFGVKVV
jgi:hypothetical protein